MKLDKNEAMTCRRCGEVSVPSIITALPPYAKKIVCPECGYTYGFTVNRVDCCKSCHRKEHQLGGL